MYKYQEPDEKKFTITYLADPIQFQATRNHYSMRHPFEWFIVETGLNINLRWAEIGVADAENSWSVMENMGIAQSWLVDTWGHALPSDKPDETFYGRNAVEWEASYQSVKNRFKDRPEVEILRMWSADAAKIVPRELDFVYIDATHDHDPVAKDFKLWLPHVKVGGWFMGDDYTYPGVMTAVQEFSLANNIDLKVSHNSTQWWFVKDRQNYIRPPEWACILE